MIPRKKLEEYMDHVKEKISKYLSGLSDEELSEKPENCPYTRLQMILAQFRHSMFHCGMSELATYDSTDEWLKYIGIAYIP
ncbi:MAG: hypothetical protein K6G75_08035 [Lachnospiraceae bacterium]|nr:hypothetical protein [Lachnospiraceae bacterium]